MRGIAGSYGSSMSNFFEETLYCSPDNYTNLCPHQLCTRVPFSPHLSPTLVMYCHCDNSHPKRWLIVVLIHISGMVTDLRILSCAYWASVLFLWKNVYLCLLFILQFGCFFDIQVCELLTHLGCSTLIGHFICKYFLSFFRCFAFLQWFNSLCKSF